MNLSDDQMRAIDRVVGTSVERRGVHPSGDAAAAFFGARESLSGVEVNEQSALAYSAVWRAVTLIATVAGRLPMHVYQRRGDDRVQVVDHDAERLLNRKANHLIDGATLRETMTMHVLTWGHGEAEIIRRGDGRPDSLKLLLPWNVRPELTDDDRLFFIVREGGGERPIAAENVLRIIGPSPDGIQGYSPIRIARESIGVGLAAEQFGAAFFGNAARPSGTLETTGKLSDQAIARLKASFREKHESGPTSSGRVLVLEEGLAFKSMTIPPEEAQFLQTRVFQIDEIARWYGIPPHMLFELERATFSNIEAQGEEFLRYALRPWLDRWQRAAGDKLLLPMSEQRDHYIEANTSSVVSADLAARNASYNVGRQGGWLSVNEIRRAENKPGIGPQGDVYLQPLNMADAAKPGATPPTDPAANAQPTPAPTPTPKPRKRKR